MSLPISATRTRFPGAEAPDTWIVVPCYNEERRLDTERFIEFAAQRPWVGLLFVDDGSGDNTRSVLHTLVDRLGHQGACLQLHENQGKAEAVRMGMAIALRHDAPLAGYWDADLATPLEAIDDFRERLYLQPQLTLVLGTRMPLMGRAIERHPLRAWIGRCFARVASVTMRFRVWDTQCGAKLFRANQATRTAFGERFHSNWIFDVEIISRLTSALGASQRSLSKALYEVPLDHWREVPGSKVKSSDFAKAALELARLFWAYRCRQWQASKSPAEVHLVAHDLFGGLLNGFRLEAHNEHRSKAA